MIDGLLILDGLARPELLMVPIRGRVVGGGGGDCGVEAEADLAFDKGLGPTGLASAFSAFSAFLNLAGLAGTIGGGTRSGLDTGLFSGTEMRPIRRELATRELVTGLLFSGVTEPTRSGGGNSAGSGLVGESGHGVPGGVGLLVPDGFEGWVGESGQGRLVEVVAVLGLEALPGFLGLAGLKGSYTAGVRWRGAASEE